jgi:RNA polymerase sigma factor (sigma-70 family)
MTRAGDADDEASDWDIADDSPLPEEVLAELQQLDQLRHALGRLEQRCRDLLLILFQDDGDALPYEEVAQRLGMPVGSIGPTRLRCLAKLRQLVEPAPDNT